ncbi:Deoxycytidine monophosphate (dCMP) deaminase [Sporothrix stenoceras]
MDKNREVDPEQAKELEMGTDDEQQQQQQQQLQEQDQFPTDEAGHVDTHIAAGLEADQRPTVPPGLVSLDYNPWDHRRKLVLMTGLLMTEFCFLPVALYYPLWYDTTLSHGVLFAIITSFFGVVTGVEFALRSWRLLQPAGTYRPLGGRRWALDATHWILLVVYSLMTAVLIGASVPKEPLVRPLALPSTMFLIIMAFLLLSTGILHHRRVISPWRISSTPGRYTYAFRPLTYTLVEDVVAVDGGAGRAYRQRLAVRWGQSPRFRALLARLNWLWGVGCLLGGAMTMTILWTTSQDVAYGFGWAGPLVV